MELKIYMIQLSASFVSLAFRQKEDLHNFFELNHVPKCVVVCLCMWVCSVSSVLSVGGSSISYFLI